MINKNFITDPSKEAREILSEMLASNTISGVARDLGVNKGLIPYVLDGGYSPTLLNALNVPLLVKETVVACPGCGKIHSMQKTCEARKRNRVRFRKIAEVESKEQQDALSEMARDNDCDSWSAMCRQMAQDYLDGYKVLLAVYKIEEAC